MKKRFTDADKWTDNKWFRTLAPKYKLFWLYLLDKVDAAGIIEPDMELASFLIGEKYEEDEVLSVFDERIAVLDNGKWMVLGFVKFQCGTLNPSARPHKSIIDILEKNGIDYRELPEKPSMSMDRVSKGYAKGIQRVSKGYAKGIQRVSKGYAKGIQRVSKGYAKGIDTLKEKEKEKDKDLDKDTVQEKEESPVSTKEDKTLSIEERISRRREGVDAIMDMARKSGNPSQEFMAVKEYFAFKFLERYRTEYAWAGWDEKNIQRLLKMNGFETVVKGVDNYFSASPPEKQCISELYGRFSEIVSGSFFEKLKRQNRNRDNGDGDYVAARTNMSDEEWLEIEARLGGITVAELKRRLGLP